MYTLVSSQAGCHESVSPMPSPSLFCPGSEITLDLQSWGTDLEREDPGKALPIYKALPEWPDSPLLVLGSSFSSYKTLRLVATAAAAPGSGSPGDDMQMGFLIGWIMSWQKLNVTHSQLELLKNGIWAIKWKTSLEVWGSHMVD